MAGEPVRPLKDTHFADEMERLIAEARGDLSALSSRVEESSGEGSEGQAPQADYLEELKRIETRLDAQQQELAVLKEIKGLLEKAGAVESAHQRLFDALHEELSGYKDGFLFDALQKPFIKDLLSLHDDIAGAERRAVTARNAYSSGLLEASGVADALETACENFANLMHYLVEILTRLDVAKNVLSEGTADLQMHRVIGTLPADDPGWDGKIAESVRPGFSWRDRVLRPEDVIVYRYHPESSGE